MPGALDKSSDGSLGGPAEMTCEGMGTPDVGLGVVSGFAKYLVRGCGVVDLGVERREEPQGTGSALLAREDPPIRLRWEELCLEETGPGSVESTPVSTPSPSSVPVSPSRLV